MSSPPSQRRKLIPAYFGLTDRRGPILHHTTRIPRFRERHVPSNRKLRVLRRYSGRFLFSHVVQHHVATTQHPSFGHLPGDRMRLALATESSECSSTNTHSHFAATMSGFLHRTTGNLAYSRTSTCKDRRDPIPARRATRRRSSTPASRSPYGRSSAACAS